MQGIRALDSATYHASAAVLPGPSVRRWWGARVRHSAYCLPQRRLTGSSHRQIWRETRRSTRQEHRKHKSSTLLSLVGFGGHGVEPADDEASDSSAGSDDNLDGLLLHRHQGRDHYTLEDIVEALKEAQVMEEGIAQRCLEASEARGMAGPASEIPLGVAAGLVIRDSVASCLEPFLYPMVWLQVQKLHTDLNTVIQVRREMTPCVRPVSVISACVCTVSTSVCNSSYQEPLDPPVWPDVLPDGRYMRGHPSDEPRTSDLPQPRLRSSERLMLQLRQALQRCRNLTFPPHQKPQRHTDGDTGTLSRSPICGLGLLTLLVCCHRLVLQYW